jgi:ketosteroid isomerase-like protein
MEPAPDVRDAYLRFTKAFSSGDVSAVAGTFSRVPGVVEIGSAPDAWSEGYETIANRLAAVSGAIAGASIESGDAIAFQEGTVAWLADRPIMTTPEGMRVSARVTVVFRREVDGWKIVQSHLSIGRRLTGT